MARIVTFLQSKLILLVLCEEKTNRLYILETNWHWQQSQIELTYGLPFAFLKKRNEEEEKKNNKKNSSRIKRHKSRVLLPVTVELHAEQRWADNFSGFKAYWSARCFGNMIFFSTNILTVAHNLIVPEIKSAFHLLVLLIYDLWDAY